MGRGRTATATTASNVNVPETALGMHSKCARQAMKTNERDQPPPDESDDSSRDSGARKTRRSIQAVSKEQNVNAIIQNQSTKTSNARSRLRKSTQLNHTSSINLAESRTQKSSSHNSNNRTDEILVVSDGMLLKNRVYEGIHSNNVESTMEESSDVANDENVVNVVEISDETDNLSMDTDTITTESSLLPDSTDTTCSADDEAESSTFSEDSQTRSSSIVTVAPDDSNSMQAVDGEKQKDPGCLRNVAIMSSDQEDTMYTNTIEKTSEKSEAEKLTSIEVPKTPDKPTPQLVTDSEDRLLSSPDFFNLPKPKIVRTYQNRRKLRADTLKKQEAPQEIIPSTNSVDELSVNTKPVDKTKSPENIQAGERQEVTECRRSQRQRVIKYEVRDLFNLKGSRNQLDAKSQRSTSSSLYKTAKDSPRSELSSSPQTFRGFSDTDDPSSPIHFATRPLSRQNNATPTSLPHFRSNECDKPAKTNLAEKFSNATKSSDTANIHNKISAGVTSENEKQLDTPIKCPSDHESSEEAKPSIIVPKKEVKKPVRILPRRKTVLLNRMADESESTSESIEALKESVGKIDEFLDKNVERSKTFDKVSSEAVNESDISAKLDETIKPKVSSPQSRKAAKTKPLKFVPNDQAIDDSVEAPCNISNAQRKLENEQILNEISNTPCIAQAELKETSSLSQTDIDNSQMCNDLQQLLDDKIIKNANPEPIETDLICSKVFPVSKPITNRKLKSLSPQKLKKVELKEDDKERSPKVPKKRGRPAKIASTQSAEKIQTPVSSFEADVDESSSQLSKMISHESSDSSIGTQKARKPRSPKIQRKSLSPKCNPPNAEGKSYSLSKEITQPNDIEITQKCTNEAFESTLYSDIIKKIEVQSVTDKTHEDKNNEKANKINAISKFHNESKATLENTPSKLFREKNIDQIKTSDKMKPSGKRPRTKGEMKLIEGNIERLHSNLESKSLIKSTKSAISSKGKTSKNKDKNEMTQIENPVSDQSQIKGIESKKSDKTKTSNSKKSKSSEASVDESKLKIQDGNLEDSQKTGENIAQYINDTPTPLGELEYQNITPKDNLNQTNTILKKPEGDAEISDSLKLQDVTQTTEEKNEKSKCQLRDTSFGEVDMSHQSDINCSSSKKRNKSKHDSILGSISRKMSTQAPIRDSLVQQTTLPAKDFQQSQSSKSESKDDETVKEDLIENKVEKIIDTISDILKNDSIGIQEKRQKGTDEIVNIKAPSTELPLPSEKTKTGKKTKRKSKEALLNGGAKEESKTIKVKSAADKSSSSSNKIPTLDSSSIESDTKQTYNTPGPNNYPKEAKQIQNSESSNYIQSLCNKDITGDLDSARLLNKESSNEGDIQSDINPKCKSKIDTNVENKKSKTEEKVEKSQRNDEENNKNKSGDGKSQSKSRKKRPVSEPSFNEKISCEVDSSLRSAKAKMENPSKDKESSYLTSKVQKEKLIENSPRSTLSYPDASVDNLNNKQQVISKPRTTSPQMPESIVLTNSSNKDDLHHKATTPSDEGQREMPTYNSENHAEKSTISNIPTINKPKPRTRSSRWDQEHVKIPKKIFNNEISTENIKLSDEKTTKLEEPAVKANAEIDKIFAKKRKIRSLSKSHSTSDGISDNYSSDSSDSRHASKTRSAKLSDISLTTAEPHNLDKMLDTSSKEPASNLSSVLNGLSKTFMSDLLEWTCNNKQTVLQIKDKIDLNQKAYHNVKADNKNTAECDKSVVLATREAKDTTASSSSVDKDVILEKTPMEELYIKDKIITDDQCKVAPIIQTSKEMLAELMSDSLDADTDHFSESSEASTKADCMKNDKCSPTEDIPLNTTDKTSDPEHSTKSSDSEPADQNSQDSSVNIRRSHRIKTQAKTTVGRGLVRDKSDRNQNSASALDLEVQNAKFLKDMEERLSQFQMIKENEYKCERIISREAKRMTCDCFLTRDEEKRGELGCGEDCLNRLLMIECSGNCNVGDRCTNRRFQKNIYSPCKVFRTEKKGFGILADGEIGTGEFIMEYVGEVLNGKQFERRAAIYSQDKNKHYYFMALRGDSIIDATMKGNISRFINHSCDPNAETQKWTVNGELRIGFFSKRRIYPGEEITFDYQFQRYGKEAQKCFCESANCRGWIGEEPESEDEEEVTSSESEEEIEDKQLESLRDKDKEKKEELQIIEKASISEDIIRSSGEALISASVQVPSVPELEKVSEKIVSIQKPSEKDISARKALKAAEKFARIAAKIKARKERERLKQQARMALEDPDLEAQISSLETTGLKNQPLTLKLSRCMVRAKYLQSKLRIFNILQKGEMACRRLFLDYHGLRLLHGWMSEIETTDVEQDLEFRLKTLETLELLPIPNITILKDSKVLHVVQNWHDEMVLKTAPESSSENSEEKSPPHKKQKECDDYLDRRKQIMAIAKKLITSWEVLPEVFRIPKRERIEQMKEHEREADRQYKAINLGDEDQYNTELRNKERFGAKKSYKWIREKYEKRKEQAPKEAEKLNSAEANLTKLQRRQLFAAKVAKDEAEKRLAEIRREFEFKCKFYGIDPRYMTPNNMPFCVHPPSGQWYSREKKKIPTPPSHAHIKVPPKPQSTDPKDYNMPEMDLPPMWKFAMDPRGRLYYYHIKIRIPQWEPPIKILPLTTDPAPEATTSTQSVSGHNPSTCIIPAINDPQPSTSKQALATTTDASSTDYEDTDSDISCSDIIGLKKGVPLKVGKDMIEELKRSRKRKRFNRLVQERTISPRREEDRLYNQVEMRRYRENKEKIRRRKEEIKRRKVLLRTEEEPSTSTKDNCIQPIASTSQASLSIPIQDYLLSSDEDDLDKSDYDNSLIEKIVHGDKIVDELDAIAKEKPLKRPLPFVKDPVDIKKRIKLDDSKKRTESSKSDKSSKSRKAETGVSKNVSRKAREKFRSDIAGIIVHHLAPYRRDTCPIGKITNNEDFKHLARKLTHFVLLKELKHCDLTGQTLVVTESVKNKSREFIKKYMAKYGKVYVKPANDPEFRDIPH